MTSNLLFASKEYVRFQVDFLCFNFIPVCLEQGRVNLQVLNDRDSKQSKWCNVFLNIYRTLFLQIQIHAHKIGRAYNGVQAIKGTWDVSMSVSLKLGTVEVAKLAEDYLFKLIMIFIWTYIYSDMQFTSEPHFHPFTWNDIIL